MTFSRRLLWAACAVAATAALALSCGLAQADTLYLFATSTAQSIRFDANDNWSHQTFGTNNFFGATIGPDNMFYAAGMSANVVRRYNPVTLEGVPGHGQSDEDYTPFLTDPRGMTFHEGDLYVNYRPTTGVYNIRVFEGPDADEPGTLVMANYLLDGEGDPVHQTGIFEDLVYWNDAFYWITRVTTSQCYLYRSADGVNIQQIASYGYFANRLAVGPDDLLYVSASSGTGANTKRYNASHDLVAFDKAGPGGTPLDHLPYIGPMAFHPFDGTLYIGRQGQES